MTKREFGPNGYYEWACIEMQELDGPGHGLDDVDAQVFDTSAGAERYASILRHSRIEMLLRISDGDQGDR